MKVKEISKELEFDFVEDIADEQQKCIMKFAESKELGQEWECSNGFFCILTNDIDKLDKNYRDFVDYFKEKKIEINIFFNIKFIIDTEEDDAFDYLAKYVKSSIDDLEITYYKVKFFARNGEDYYLVTMNINSTNEVEMEIIDVLRKRDLDFKVNCNKMIQIGQKIINY